MDYIGIIKKSFQITLKNKFLWFLAILAAFTEGGSNFNVNLGQFNSADLQKLREQFQNKIPSSPGINSSASGLVMNSQVLGAQTTNIANWFSEHWAIILVIFLIFILVFLAFMVISEMAKAGLIWGIFKIEKGEKTNFGECFKTGFRRFWQIFGLEIVLGLIILASLTIIAVPMIFLLYFKVYVIAIVWIILMILPIILFFIFLGILRQYALRYISIESIGMSNSLKAAWQLFRHKLKDSILIWLVAVVLGLVIGIALAICLVIAVAILVLLGVGLYFAAGTIAVAIYASLFGIALIMALILVSGAINTFIFSYWTLAFLEIKK